jgi:hypothetical protein
MLEALIGLFEQATKREIMFCKKVFLKRRRDRVFKSLLAVWLLGQISIVCFAQDLEVKAEPLTINGRVPLALAHLYGQEFTGALAKVGPWEMARVELENKALRSRTLQLKLELQGLGRESTKTVQVGPSSTTEVLSSPIIDLRLLREFVDERVAKLEVEVVEDQAIVYSNVLNITLTGKDDIPMVQDSKPLYFFLATRVQPKSRLVTEVLKEAGQRLGLRFRQGIVGYQGQNDPSQMLEDVRKIYKTIQAMDFVYVNTPVSFEAGYQRIKTPIEAFETKNGNCIEGALLFASCIAAIGYDPLIVIIPGHAFVIATIPGASPDSTRDYRTNPFLMTLSGGRPALPSNSYASWIPIETTVLQYRSNQNFGLTRMTFEEAVEIAKGKLQMFASPSELKKVFLIDVEAWRSCGLLPAPDDP